MLSFKTLEIWFRAFLNQLQDNIIEYICYLQEQVRLTEICEPFFTFCHIRVVRLNSK